MNIYEPCGEACIKNRILKVYVFEKQDMIVKKILTLFFRFFFTPFWRIRFINTIMCGGKITCIKSNICHIDSSYLKNNQINISGRNNRLRIKTILAGSDIDISGINNTVSILCEDIVNNLHLQVHGDNCVVLIDKGTAINGLQAICMGNGVKIIIGKNCLFARNIDIWSTDSHPIYNINDTVNPINPSKDIILKDHVWIGEKACLLKGVVIESNAIVGMGAVVTKNVPESSIVAGNPAVIVKQGITWKRDHIKV